MGEARSIIEKDKPIKVGERQTQDYKICTTDLLEIVLLILCVAFPSVAYTFRGCDSYYIEGRQYTKSSSMKPEMLRNCWTIRDRNSSRIKE